MVWLLYNLVLVLTAIFWVPWMYLRARKRNEPPNWKERGGDYSIPKRADRKRIWLHAVSVGEIIAARPIISEIRNLLPEYDIVLTCTTSSGHSVAEGMVGKLIDYLFYFPVDVPKFCMAAMTRVEPAVVAIMETELWLNFLWSAKAVGAKTCLVNGRISDRSFSRSKYLRFLYREIFAKLDKCLMQTESDAERAKYFGAQNVAVLGNSKYDESGADAKEFGWKLELGLSADEKLVVVGSARGEDEEDLIIEALQGIDARIVFAPRHVERAVEIVSKANAAGFEAGRRSKGENRAKFLILDTFGELASLYPVADLAIIGGGFALLGGQNIIQPMAAGCPVLCGPNMKNFREPFEQGLAAGALRVAKNAGELREAVELLLRDKELRQKMGEAGKRLVEENLGAAKRYAIEIAKLAKEFEAENRK